ncbi:hypothetical protein L1887_31608 [Cichorium endivia]|nr:hypothetical protein L1887_31608 [Cichorium endivia]
MKEGEEEEDHQGVRIGFHGFQQDRQKDQSLGDCSFHRRLGGAAAAQPQQKKRSYLFSSVEDDNAPGEKMWKFRAITLYGQPAGKTDPLPPPPPQIQQ